MRSMSEKFYFVIALCAVPSLGIKDPTKSCQQNVLSLNKIKIEAKENRASLKVFDKYGALILDGNLGLDLPREFMEPSLCKKDDDCLEWGDVAKLKLIEDGDFCTDVSWETSVLKSLKDCFYTGYHFGFFNHMFHFMIRGGGSK